MELLHIYAKEGVIKVIRAEKKWIEHDKLIESGYVYVKPINPVTFIEYLHNHCEENDIVKEIENLGVPI